MNLCGLQAKGGSMYGPKQPVPEQLIDQFQDDLRTVTPGDIFKLPDFRSEIVHTSSYVQVGKSIPRGMYLDAGDDSRQGIYKPDLGFAFQAQPANRLTREDSHNAVFFGRLWMLPKDSGAEEYTQVAVKSRTTDQKEKLIGEAALFQHIDGLGLETFGVGALMVGAEMTHLMTYFKGRVATMDTVDWDEATPDEAWFEVGKVVDTMYKLHTNMLFHGDLAFRNVAFDETGNTVIIDPELMTSPRKEMEALMDANMILDGDQQIILSKLVLRMSHEFTEACRSIDSQIIPVLSKRDRPRGSEARLKLYKKHLFEPYRNKVRDAPEPIRSVLLRIFDEMMVRKKADAAAERL